MEDKDPKNVTEFSEKESVSSSNVSSEETTTIAAPKNTIDMQKFRRNLATQAAEKQNEEEGGEEGPPPLTWKEIKSLKRNRYFDIKDKFDKAFVLQNKRTDQIAEIQAASSYHACKIIGWKSNRTKVIDVINVKEREAEILKKVENVPAETSESSG